MISSGKRNLLRVAVLMAAILTLAAARTSPAGANQSGPGVNDIAGFQIALCELAGGKAAVTVSRTVGSGLQKVYVDCKGGLLGGMSCGTTPYASSCKLLPAPAGDPAPGTDGPFDGGDLVPAEDLTGLTQGMAADDAAPVDAADQPADQPADGPAVGGGAEEPSPSGQDAPAEDAGDASNPDEPVIDPTPDLGGETIATGDVLAAADAISDATGGGSIADVTAAGPTIVEESASVTSAPDAPLAEDEPGDDA